MSDLTVFCSGCRDTGRCQGMDAADFGETPCECSGPEDCPTVGWCPLWCDLAEELSGVSEFSSEEIRGVFNAD